VALSGSGPRDIDSRTDRRAAFLCLIYVSFVSYIHVPGPKTWELLTLDNYRTNLTETRTYRALQNSIFLATEVRRCVCCGSANRMVTTKTRVAGAASSKGSRLFHGHSWNGAGHRSALDLLYVPLPIYGNALDFVDRLHHSISALRSTLDDEHDRAVA
jgi:hypothetical protein